MAVQLADQMKEDYRRYPIDDHGKLRMQYFSIGVITPLAVAIPANDMVKLFTLPPGRKRLLPGLSRISTSALGSGRTIDIGHGEYMRRPPDNDLELADYDAFIDGMDVSAQVSGAAWSTALKFDMYSMAEVDVYLTILGGTIPVAGTIAGYLAYLYE